MVVVTMDVVVVMAALRLLLGSGFFGEDCSLEGVSWLTSFLLIINGTGSNGGGGLLLVFAAFDLDSRQ
jgi:hypothetical protein